MTYRVQISKSANKVLEKICEPDHSRIRIAITQLGINPRPAGCKKLKGRDGYRIRQGDYRIIYMILDDILVVNVIDLGHRKNIYR